MSAVANPIEASFRDAIALLEEFGGASIDEKLAVFGVSADELRPMLEERWETYRLTYDPAMPHVIFVQAMVEGLLAGTFLKERLQS